MFIDITALFVFAIILTIVGWLFIEPDNSTGREESNHSREYRLWNN